MRTQFRRAGTIAAVTAAVLFGSAAAPADAQVLKPPTKSELIRAAEAHAPAVAAGTLPRGTSVQVRGAVGVVSSTYGDAELRAHDTSDSVVRRTSDGVQALTVLRKGETSATFTLDLPDGHVLKRAQGGSLKITDAEGAVFFGAVRAPWAVDAAGRQLETRYVLRGDVITQEVETRGATYPIVADPWISYGWFVYVNFNKSEVKSLARYADYYQLAAAACGFIPVPWVAVACAVAVGWMAINFGNTVKTAARNNQCVNLRFTYGGGLAGWGRFNC